MKKFKFFIQTTEEKIVEAETAEEARMKLVNSGEYEPYTYIDDGKEVDNSNESNTKG